MSNHVVSFNYTLTDKTGKVLDHRMRYARVLSMALAGWFLFLVTVHYFNQRPLWNDEQCVFTSVRAFSPVQFFTQALSASQAFPRVYLCLLQSVSSCFDFHLLALRFLPFAAMLVAFFVWMRIAARSLKAETLPLYVLAWTASIPLVYYAAELKQYSMDVLASGACLWMLCRGFNRGWYAIPALCLLSYPSVFWMPLFYWNLFRHGQNERQFRPLFLFTAISAAALFLLFYFDIRVSGNDDIGTYWQDYFISFGSFAQFFQTLGEGINNLISRWFAESPKWIRAVSRGFIGLGFGYMLFGFWRAFKAEGFRFQSVRTAAMAVFAGHLFLGALHKYPFVVPRTSLFFAPALLLLSVLAMQKIRERYKAAGTVIQVVFAVYLAVVSFGIAGQVIGRGDLGAQSVLWSKP